MRLGRLAEFALRTPPDLNDGDDNSREMMTIHLIWCRHFVDITPASSYTAKKWHSRGDPIEDI